MIYLYTNTDSEKEYILMNDQYFNLNTANKDFSEEVKQAIWDIDKAKLTDKGHIETKYGIGLLRNLTLNDIRIYMTHPERFQINDDVQICFNEKEIVSGRRGYESWWSKEYERREKNDL